MYSNDVLNTAHLDHTRMSRDKCRKSEAVSRTICSFLGESSVQAYGRPTNKPANVAKPTAPQATPTPVMTFLNEDHLSSGFPFS